MSHLKGRKFIFYVKGKDEIVKMEIIKERNKGFMCLTQVMICDKKLRFGKLSYCSRRDMQTVHFDFKFL